MVYFKMSESYTIGLQMSLKHTIFRKYNYNLTSSRRDFKIIPCETGLFSEKYANFRALYLLLKLFSIGSFIYYDKVNEICRFL